MSGRLEGKVAVVTGAASGIGAATAKTYVDHGARVVLGDIQDEAGKSMAGAIYIIDTSVEKKETLFYMAWRRFPIQTVNDYVYP